MNKKKRKLKKISFKGAHPIITYVITTFILIVLSFVFYLFNVGTTYELYSLTTGDYTPITEHIIPMLNLSGLKYIFTYSVSNFANYPVLTNLIIILIGIGIMDKSGFLQTGVSLLTKKAKKTSVTFCLILLCLFASVIGDLAFIILIPLVALFFYYGKRNPIIGIIASYGALTVGNGISIIFTALDSSLRDITLLNANVLQIGYQFSTYGLIIVNIIVMIIAAIILTKITENNVAKRFPKYDFPETDIETDVISKKEFKAMFYALITGAIYCMIIIWNIIPGLSISGLSISGYLLDNSQTLYIDKLFSSDSFFSTGFVFIITMLFIIWGYVYGKTNKTINDDKELVTALSYSLDGIGKTLLLIFAASICLSIYQVTNIGVTLTAYMTNWITNMNFIGVPLVILLLVVSILSTIILPESTMKWAIIGSGAVPVFMNAGLTPEFSQIVFRFGEAVSLGITPMFVYFIVYLAFIQKYNQEENSISIIEAIKYQIPYSIATLCIVFIIIMLFYICNLPLGLGGLVSL